MDERKFCMEHSGVCKKLESLKEQLTLRFDALDKAMAQTKSDLDVRLGGMNEFRAQLERQAITFIPRSEADLVHSRLEEKLDMLLNRVSEHAGSTRWIDHIVTALIGMAVVLTVYFMTR